MTSIAVPVLQLSAIEPHPNADRLELAVVGGYRVVTAKGSLNVGDRVIYIPTDAVIPAETAEWLGVARYLAGREKNRVKAVRLRGVLSEGIVLPASIVPSAREGDDVAARLGITKYEPPVPVVMQGVARPWPSFVPHYDIENIKRAEWLHAIAEGTPVVVTEKVHGTNCTVALGPGLEESEAAYVCQRSAALVENTLNLYWRAVRKHEIIERLTTLRDMLISEGRSIATISLHGEVLGCQDLRYGHTMSDPGFVAFDLRINGAWVPASEFFALCSRVEMPAVPVLYTGPFAYAMLEPLAEGPSRLHAAHMREGVVVRPQCESLTANGDRVIAKYISGTYLTRAGEATELH